HIQPASYTTAISERPMASRLVRAQVARDAMVTNLAHRSVHVADEMGRRLLSLLDGTRDRETLLDELMKPGGAVPPEQPRESVGRDLDRNLDALAKLALLSS